MIVATQYNTFFELAGEYTEYNNMKDFQIDYNMPELNSLEALITNHLKKVHQGAYDDDTYRSFYSELMQNVDAGRVKLDGLDVEDEFDNFISVNMDNVSLREALD